MEGLLRQFLKGYFEDYVEGLDKTIDCSRFPVNIHGLKIKEQPFRVQLDGSALEFSEGTIGRVQLNITWGGSLEILATDIRLNFNFYPVTAMKNMLLSPAEERSEEKSDGEHKSGDQEDDVENLVPMDVLQQLNSLATQPPPPPLKPPRFCALHGTSDKRNQGDPHNYECENCRKVLQTTYLQPRLCPFCSNKENRCLCCAAPAVANDEVECGNTADAGVATLHTIMKASLRPAHRREPGPGPTTTPQQTGYAASPVFCLQHSCSEFRPKGEPQEHVCQGCSARLHTSYAQLALCPLCSGLSGRCLICSRPKVSEGHVPSPSLSRNPELPGAGPTDATRDQTDERFSAYMQRSASNKSIPPASSAARVWNETHQTDDGWNHEDWLPPPPPVVQQPALPALPRLLPRMNKQAVVHSSDDPQKRHRPKAGGDHQQAPSECRVSNIDFDQRPPSPPRPSEQRRLHDKGRRGPSESRERRLHPPSKWTSRPPSPPRKE